MSQLIATIRHRMFPARSGSVSERLAATQRRREVLLIGMGIFCLATVCPLTAAINAKHGPPNNLPATKRVISIGGEPRSLAVDGDRILIAGAEGRVSELSSSTGTRLREKLLRRPLREIAAFDGRVYVASDDGYLSAFARTKPERNQSQRVTRGAAVLSVTASNRGVFVARHSHSLIEQRSGRTLRVLSRVRLPGKVSDIIATPEGVWAALWDPSRVAFIPYGRHGRHGRPTLVAGYPRPQALSAGEGSIWVASKAPRVLWAIDEKRRSLSAAIKPAVIPLPSSVSVGNGAVWVASAERDRLVQIGAGSGQLSDRFPVGTGRRPRDVVVDASAVWTSNFGDGTVTRIDLQRLGIAHRLPRPADEPPRLAGISRSVWAATAVVLMGISIAFGFLRWLEGLVLDGLAGAVPRCVRPLYCDQDELGYLVGRQPVKEVVTDQRERKWTGTLGKGAHAALGGSGMRRSEKVFDAQAASDLVRDVIANLAHRGKLHRDFACLPLDDMTALRRLEYLSDDMLIDAMRARHDRLPDAAVLIAGETWNLERIDDTHVRMTLRSVRSGDWQRSFRLPRQVQLHMRLSTKHVVEGRGKRRLESQGTIACDVLAIVERRIGSGLELSAVALYTPVSDEVPSVLSRRALTQRVDRPPRRRRGVGPSPAARRSPRWRQG